MFMVWSQSATINDPWRCAAPSNWLGNRVERAKCLKKLQQGLQASTCLASARQRPMASTTRARCLEHASRSYAWTTTQFHEPSGKRLRVKVSSRGTVWLGACGRHDLNPKWAIHDLRVLQGRGNRTTNPDEQVPVDGVLLRHVSCRDEYLRHR